MRKIYTITPLASPQVTCYYNINVARKRVDGHIKSRDFVVDEERASLFVDALENPHIELNGGLIEVWGTVKEAAQ